MKDKEEKHSYSIVEKLLIFLAIAIFGAMGYAYLNDISIKKLFFPSAEDKFLSTPIGKSVSIKGSALRQRASDFEFKPLAENADLYPNDTLMTGPDSTLSIVINKDNKQIDLAPNSLVKLTFGQDFQVTGTVHLEVIKGEKVDEDSNVQLVLSNLTPEKNAQLEFTAEEFAERKKSVTVTFTVNKKTARVTVHVFIPEGGGKPRREVSSIAPVIDGQRASAMFTFNGPGAYEWEIQDLAGKVLMKSAFQIARSITMIETLPTLNNTNRLDGLATKKTFDGFVLRWKPVPGPGEYVVRVFKASGGAILQKRMTATELNLNKNNLLLGKLHYSVEKELPEGFIATSAKTEFGFAFLPPELMAPANNVALNPNSLYQTNNLIFFTWSKTNYTDNYLFEMAADPAFKSIRINKTLRDNYLSHIAPAPGRYYWRVRSQSNGIWSDFSGVRSFSVSAH